MARFNYLQSNFTSGEISTKLNARSDLKEYVNGCDLIENMLPTFYGAASTRRGAELVYSATDNGLLKSGAGTVSGSKNYQLIKFFVSKNEYYLIIINLAPSSPASYFLNILDKNMASVFTYSLPSTTAIRASRLPLTWVQDSNYLILTLCGVLPPIVITRIKENSFSADYYYTFNTIAPFKAHAFKPVNVDTNIKMKPSGTSGNITFSCQDASANPVPYFSYNKFGSTVHGSYFRIVNSALTTEGAIDVKWPALITVFDDSLVDSANDKVVFLSSHGYLTGDKVTLDPQVSLPTGLLAETDYYLIRLSATEIRFATTLANAIAGTYIDLTTTGTGAVVIRDIFISHLTGFVVLAPADTNATDIWYESKFGGSSNWPKLCYSFEQRLLFLNVEDDPKAVCLSSTGKLFEFLTRPSTSTTAATAADAFNFSVSSPEFSEIVWVAGTRSLQIGTTDDEHIIDSNNGLSVADIKARTHTNYGSKFIKPVFINNRTLYVDKSGKKIREFKYNDENGSYISRNLSVLNPDIIHHNVTSNFFDVEFLQLVYQKSNEVMWGITTEHQLISFTYSDTTDVIAWSRHTLGGLNSSLGSPTPLILSLCSLNNSEGSDNDSLYMIVERTINSQQVRTLEKIAPQEFESTNLTTQTDGIEDRPVYLDSSVRYYGASVNKVPWALVSHLNGQTVGVLYNGNSYKTVTCTETTGYLELGVSATEFIIGLPYTPKLLSKSLEAGATQGTSQGSIIRIDRLYVKFHKTAHAKVGSSATELDTVVFDGLETKQEEIHLPSSPDRNAQVYITSDKPLPLTVLGYTARGITYED